MKRRAGARAAEQRRARWLLGIAATIAVLAAWLGGALAVLERPLIDLRARWFDRHSPAPSDRVVIVAIDDASLETVQRWPWDRQRLAWLVEELTLAGADVVALDLILKDPQEPRWSADGAGPPRLVRDDDELARAIAAHGRVVAGTAFPARADDTGAPGATDDGPRASVARVPMRGAVSAVARARAGRWLATAAARALAAAAPDTATASVFAACCPGPPAAWLRPWLVDLLPAGGRVGESGPQWRRALTATDAASVLLDAAGDSSLPPPPGPTPRPWAASDDPEPWTRPVAAASARLAGVSADTFDPDGAVRKIPVVIRSLDRLWLNLGVSAATLHLRTPAESLRVDGAALVIPAREDLPELRLALTQGRVAGQERFGLHLITWPRGAPSGQAAGRAAGWQWQFYDTARDLPAELPAGRVLEPRLLAAAINENLTGIAGVSRAVLHSMNADQRMIDAAQLARLEAAARSLRANPVAGAALDELEGIVRDACAKTVQTVSWSAPEPGTPEELALPEEERLLYAAFREATAALPRMVAELRDGIARVAQARRELRDRVAGRIVFVGWTATGAIADFVPTSISPKTPGVHLHAALANTVLTGFQRTVAPAGVGAACVAAMGLAGTALGIYTGVALSPLAVAGAGAAWFLLAGALAWDAGRLVLPVAGPVLASLAALAAVYIHRLVSEQRSRRRTEERFKSYVSPEVVDILVNNPELTSMRPARKELTILFTDLAGFTTIAERLGSQRTAEVLAAYLGRMTEVVQKHGATLDKYIGDAIVAFWGAPIDNPRHAADACRAVADMLKTLDAMNASGQFADVGPEGLVMRVGLATGEVMVGDFGNPPRNSSYTVLGDTANLASRLEGANKAFGTRALVSARTRELAQRDDPGAHTWDLVGNVRVKGKLEPIELWSLRVPRPGQAEADAADAALTNAAVAHYIAGRLAEARAGFEALRARPEPPGSGGYQRPLADMYLAALDAAARAAESPGAPNPPHDGTITLVDK